MSDAYIPPNKVVVAKKREFMWFPLGLAVIVIAYLFGIDLYSSGLFVVIFALSYGVQVGYNRLTQHNELLEMPPK
jgi:hypothetical protein